MMEQSESPSTRSSFNDDHRVGGDKIVRDFYAVLEVPPNASGEHIGVSFNRLYNQMVALQHSGPQTDEATASFKELNEAYEVLSDPVKRRAYDKRNLPTTPASSDSIVGRAFGAIASRFGTPAASTAGPSPGLPQDILDTIGIMCQQGGIEGSAPPMDPRIGDIRWGVGIESKVDRQAACYYRLSVTSDDVENGFIVHCKSSNKDKFKLVMFDSNGGFLYKEESSRGTKQSTEATLFFVSYDIYNTDSDASYQPVSQLHSDSDGHQGSAHGNDPNISQEKWSRERDISSNIPVSDKIDSAIRQKNTVGAGQYLVCVYGDNIMVKTSFSLIAVRAKNDASEVALIKSTGGRLVGSKVHLMESEGEYVRCRAALDVASKELRKHEDSALELIESRDKAYRGLIEASIGAYPKPVPATQGGDVHLTPSGSPAPVPPSTHSQSLLSGLGSISLLGSDNGGGSKMSVGNDNDGGKEQKPAARVSVAAAAASSAASSAVTSASMAGGWLAKRISESVSQLKQSASKSSPSPGGKDPGPESGIDHHTNNNTEKEKGAEKDAAWPSYEPKPLDSLPAALAMGEKEKLPVSFSGIKDPGSDLKKPLGEELKTVDPDLESSEANLDRFENCDIANEDIDMDPFVVQPLTR